MPYSTQGSSLNRTTAFFVNLPLIQGFLISIARSVKRTVKYKLTLNQTVYHHALLLQFQ